MAKYSDEFDKFVRLKLTGEIVEVLSSDAKEITINFRGQNLTLHHHEVSRLTPEEAAEAAKRISSWIVAGRNIR
jgi:hypothetical protein